MRLGFIFRSLPHSTSKGREGLDAILAASAFCEDIEVFFIGTGVNQLRENQQPNSVLSRDYIAAFKLLDLYDIEKVFVCRDSLAEFSMTEQALAIDAELLDKKEISQKLHACDKVITF
ncbi:MAG: sulfurtransferase complex subunit TusC [Vibrio sp.]